MPKNYYLSSFFWSTLQRILAAILGFISVPILLGYYGKADYGILALATSCNGYMQLLDLGMNTGAVKFYAQWRKEGKNDLINRVSRTNITFYLIVSAINIVGLLALAIWGESFFSVTHEQFIQLRWCLIILCCFSPMSWVTTAFNQLLIADKRIDYTMKVQCFQTILKTALIFFAVYGHLSLTVYYFFLTLILAWLVLPYARKCLKEKLIDSIKPVRYWGDFNIVLTFSLAIFALSLFQVTAFQARPIILSIFSEQGAEAVADFRILEVMPNLIILIAGQFAAIFLPQASSLVASKDQIATMRFASKWTVLTSVISNILCFPFILCASEVLSAYVGAEYQYLSVWLIIWCLTVLSYIHTTPGNSLLLAHGDTKVLVIVTGVSCFFSIILNIILCQFYGVGAAIIAYFIHCITTTSTYYLHYYKKMGLSRRKMFMCFFKPTLLAALAFFFIYIIPLDYSWIHISSERIYYIIICAIKSAMWLLLYVALLFSCKVLDKSMLYSIIRKT